MGFLFLLPICLSFYVLTQGNIIKNFHDEIVVLLGLDVFFEMDDIGVIEKF